MFTKLKNQLGQSVLELMIAMSIFVLVVSGIMFLVLDAQTANRQGGERTKAAFLTQEAFEATQSIANQGWRNFMDGDYGLDNSGGIWEWLGNSNVFNQFTRRITVASVYRDGNGDTVESGGTIDLDSKKITVKTIWDFTTGRPSEVTLETILTNWHSTKWKQTTQAEFDVGTKNQVETTSTDDGEIQLGSAGVSSFTEWTFDTPAEYTYVPTDIEVVGSSAQLVSSGGGFSSGGTTNGSFDAVLTPWSYNDWDQTGGEVNINGLWDSPGGNPAGYAKIEIPRGKSDELGGFFEHSFVVSNNNPDIGTLDFDYSVITFDPSFNPANDSFEVLAFIDTASGAPTPGTHVWASGQISGTSSYTSVNVDISPYITTSGTYYVKLAVWITTGSQNRGPFDLGFDNAVVYWEKSGGSSSYPTTNPTIEPITSFSSPDIDAWTGFQETA
ncbi:MAG: hypothetical protein Q8O68_01110, partial [Candidatus Daviesbacteria bacterium]|nr:hypothetical protein [Candidatus Daviesbacteria bacterium]